MQREVRGVQVCRGAEVQRFREVQRGRGAEVQVRGTEVEQRCRGRGVAEVQRF